MRKPQQHFGPRGRGNKPLQVLLFFVLLLAAPLIGRAQNGYGTHMYDAIYLDMFFENEQYSDAGNNSYYNGTTYSNNYNPLGFSPNAQPSSDVWYSFSTASYLDLDISLCGSMLDSYIHLLDQYGYEIASSGAPAFCSIGYMNLSPGSYYIVVEGNGTDTGDYNMVINAYPGYYPGPLPPGANMENATSLNATTGYSNTRSNADPMLGNNIGQPSNDIYYVFTLADTSEVAISHCGSAIDTYMHLLGTTGVLATNDDSYSSPCPGTSAYIQITLPPGRYYVVSEGSGYNSGNITTSVSLVPESPPVISYTGPVYLQVGSAASLTPATSQGGIGYSISPALPIGLALNMATGGISGTPTVVSPATVYTITASNAAGSSTATLSITVAAAPVQPSQDKNYIKTTTYREPFTTVPSAPLLNQAVVGVSYLDGMGRALQQVQANGSPDGQKDIVVPVVYDAFGRQDKNYLPYATATGAGGVYKGSAIPAQGNFYNSPPPGVVQIPVVGGTTPSFAQTVFEASPLDRVLEQGASGAAWQPAATRGTTGRTVVTEHAVNNDLAFTRLDSTRQVVDFRVSLSPEWEPSLMSLSGYQAGQLLVSISKDENWTPTQAHPRAGTMEEYTDKQGRVVLKRLFNEKSTVLEMLSTYYVYDDYGNLSYVLPPGIAPDMGAPLPSKIDSLGYRYRYDDRNRLVEKQLPGKGVEYMIYNEIDQVVAIQDANQRQNNQWLVSKYDGLGRPILTGIWNNGGSAIGREVLQTMVNAQSLANLKEMRTTTGNGYTNVSWPTANLVTTLTLQYYGDYDIPDLPAAYKPLGYSVMINSLPTASRVNVLGTANMLWSVSHYDDRGQITRQFNQHYKGATVSESNFDDLSNEYSFTGLLEKSTRKHHAGSATIPAVIVTTEQTYDHMDRPLDTWTKVDNGTRILVTRNGYNEIGQAISKKLGSTNGTSFGQQVGYAYNERGWLKETSSPLFSQQLKYNEGAAPQYNGNISSQVFTRYDLGMPNPSPVSDTYSYSYDKLDRLTDGAMVGDKGRETLTYDKMGNIQSLIRTGTSSAVVDQLSYSYSGNRLMGVTDAVAGGASSEPYHLGGSTAYTYDANGNLKSRINSANTGNNITNVVYNYLNLPSTVTAAGGNVSYTYDALGRKLRSINGIQGQTRDYIGGIEYQNGSIELIHHGEGRIVRSGSDYLYEYYLKDHLGNNRSGFGAGINITAPNFSADYYPFGMQYQQYVRTGNPKNNYLYNGKELQDGLKLYDYGARLYDPVIGRWGTIDPLAEQYNNVSPYNYTLNNPIKFIDPDGRSVSTADKAALINWAKMDAAMSDEDEDQDDPKKKKDVPNNRTELKAGEDISAEERARRKRMYVDREQRKSVNYQDMSQRTTSLATMRGVVDGFAGEYAVLKVAPVLKNFFVAKKVGSSPSFIVSEGGTVFPVPKKSTGPLAVESGKGFQFVEGVGGNGLNSKVVNFRFMNPVVNGKFQYLGGYGSYLNKAGQTVNPLTGTTISKSDWWWHIPAK